MKLVRVCRHPIIDILGWFQLAGASFTFATNKGEPGLWKLWVFSMLLTAFSHLFSHEWISPEQLRAEQKEKT